MATRHEANELTLTRIYEASVESVWNAWTDPEQVAQWWGPRGFTLTSHSKDLRKGGHWHYTMHGPDGTDYPNRTSYHEVEPMKRLVYDHGATEDRPALFHVTVVFKDLGGRTEMSMTMRFPSPEEAANAKVFIKGAGGNGTWDRLAEHLAHHGDGQEIFVVNRSFEASVDTVFDMWTDPKHVVRWLPPQDSTMEYLKETIAIDQTTLFKMSFSGGVFLHGMMSYRKIKRPEFLEYVQVFSDSEGRLGKHPFLPVFPEQMLTKVLFTPEGQGKCRITVSVQPIGEVSAEELKVFMELRTSMTQGWSGSFDKLEAMLPGH